MSQLAYRASDAREHAAAYTAALLALLGARDPLEVLQATPAALRRAVAGLSGAQLAAPEAPGKWSQLQVLHHLLDSEIVGAFRFRSVLAQDRPALPGYDQDLWVERLHAGETDVELLLAEIGTLRRATLRLLARAPASERRRVGLHAERGEESLEHMLRMYAGHDLGHLRQLARIRQALGAAPAEPGEGAR